MRLTVNQMRAIRECRLKRSEWMKKGFSIVHEYLGCIEFGVNTLAQRNKRKNWK